MASPFSIFRRNQKAALAVLTLLSMFGFVFIPIIMQGMGGGGTTDPVVVKTSAFGNLHQSDLQRLRGTKQAVQRVLMQLGQDAGVPSWAIQQALEQEFGGTTDEMVVDGWLMVQRRQADGHGHQR